MVRTLVALLVVSACAAPLPDVVEPPIPIQRSDVDVFQGTGGSGFGTGSAYPGPALPFALVHPGPDTEGEAATLPALHCSGYRFEDPYVAAFSQVRMHGTGVPDYGVIGWMPTADWDGATREATAVRLAKGAEEGSPGYYRVDLGLESAPLTVEITSSLRTAVYRVRIPAAAPAPGLLLDLDYAMPDVAVVDAAIQAVSTDGVAGWVHMAGPMSGGGGRFYFDLRSDPAPASVEAWDRASAGRVGAFLRYEAGATVEIEIGLSAVDAEGAARNREEEGGGFDAVLAAAQGVWDRELGRFAVGGAAVPGDGGTPAEARRIFATSIYHALLMPTRYDDADGRYRTFQGEIGLAPVAGFYSDLSLWDTYRTLHPLLDHVAPAVQTGILESLLRMDDELGRFPRWPLAWGESGTMVGDPALMVLASSLAHGIGLEVGSPGEILDRLVHTADSRGEGGLFSRGWIALEESGGSVSKTQEYAWADAAVATVARLVGDVDAQARFEADALRHRALWDAERGFYRPRRIDGTFLSEFDETDVFDEGYTEGDAWHYLFMPMTDAAGHSELMGGADEAVARLDRFFDQSTLQEDTFLPDPYYWHGNEPDIHSAFLYALYGRPDLAARWVHWILDTKYGLGAAGLDGNDDAGTLAAWAIWASLGLYPIAGTADFVLTLPRFPVVEVPSGNGILRSVVPGCEPRPDAVIDHVEIDGERWEGWTVPVERIAGGAEIRWICGDGG